MLYVGVDLAETAPHRVCIMAEDRIADEFHVLGSAHGLRLLLEAITKFESEPAQVLIAVERPDGPFVSGLMDAGYTIYAINPKAIERFRERFALAGAKNDAVDARCLASLLRTDRQAYRPLGSDSPLTRELRMLTRDLSELEKTQTMMALQLRAALYASFPAAVSCFSDLTGPSALGLLKTFPTLEAVRSATDTELEQVLKTYGYPSPAKKVRRIREILSEEQFHVDPAVVRAKSLLIIALAETLLTVHRQIRDFDKRVKECFKCHPDREVFLSLPGAGPRLAVRMAAEFGEDRQRFASARDVAAYAGVAPVTRQSGRSRAVHFRRACCKPFRELMHQFAFCSLRWNKWAWDYYKLRRKAGKGHAESLRCLGMIWLRIIYAMWRDRTKYDPWLYLAASGRNDEHHVA